MHILVSHKNSRGVALLDKFLPRSISLHGEKLDYNAFIHLSPHNKMPGMKISKNVKLTVKRT